MLKLKNTEMGKKARIKRSYTKHGDLVKLAAKFAGVSRSMIYKALQNRAKSARAERGIALARVQLRGAARRRAA